MSEVPMYRDIEASSPHTLSPTIQTLSPKTNLQNRQQEKEDAARNNVVGEDLGVLYTPPLDVFSPTNLFREEGSPQEPLCIRN